MKNHLILLLFFNILYSNTLLCQKKINVSILTSNSLDLKKIKVSIKDGLNQHDIEPLFLHNNIFVSNEVYSEFPILWVLYPKDSTSFWVKGLVISDSNASIKFSSIDSLGNPLANCECDNAIEYDKLQGYRELENFTISEQQVLESIYAFRPSANINIDSLNELENNTTKNYFNKKLQFIREHNTLLLSFLVFKEEIIDAFFLFNADTLIKVYANFPISIKNSFEGIEVLNVLKGRTSTKYKNAPIFTSTDIQGKEITSAEFHGKYVLINFWASWCGPCVKELSMLQQIKNSYPPDKLQIISVSYDKDITAFRHAVKKFKMNWINIFGDDDLINIYGRTPIPAIYFLDKQGKILYNCFEEGGNDDKLLSIIKNVIK